MRIRPFFAVVILGVACGFGQSPADQKKPIAESEFMQLFRSEKPIQSRSIPTTIIDSALKWAAAQAAIKGKIPALVIEDSVIQGQFSIHNSVPVNKLSQAEQGYFATQVNQYNDLFNSLPKETRDRSPNFTFDVSVVPLQLVFNNTTFKGKVYLDDTLFQHSVSLYRCVFEQDVSFQGAVFEDLGHFVGSSFKESAGFWDAKFKKRSSFAFAEFSNWASFAGSRFEDGANFAQIKFHNFVSFRGAFLKEIAKFDPNEDFAEHIDFDGAKFEDVLDFREAVLDGTTTFTGTTFNQDVFFVDLNKNKSTGDKTVRAMEFPGSTFGRRVYFVNSTLTRLSFAPMEESLREANSRKDTTSRTAISPVSIAKSASFTGLKCRSADFSEVEFHELVDFSRANFTDTLSLKQTIFEQDVDFSDTVFPAIHEDNAEVKKRNVGGTILDDLQFNKSVNLNWSQLNGKMAATGPNEWKRLAETFKKAGDLQGQNECTYRQLSEERLRKLGWDRFEDDFEYIAWGYGLKPLRLLAWIAGVFLCFAVCYYTQTKSLDLNANVIKNLKRRIEFSLVFTSKTSWMLGFGYRNARTPLFKAITLINSVGIKVMVILLLKSLANLSPLLNDVAGKLIRF